MKEILIIHSGEGGATTVERFMGHDLRLRRIGCGGDAERARALITAATDGVAESRPAAIALEGMPAALELGGARRTQPARPTFQRRRRVGARRSDAAVGISPCTAPTRVSGGRSVKSVVMVR